MNKRETTNPRIVRLRKALQDEAMRHIVAVLKIIAKELRLLERRKR